MIAAPRAAFARVGVLVVVAAITESAVRASPPAPPWVEDGELAPPSWARSVAPRANDLGQPGDLVLHAAPDRGSPRRGVTRPGVSLPFFGERRGPGCSGRWWLVGPWAWACSDDASLRREEPSAPPTAVEVNGVSLRYYFVASRGASAFASIENAREGTEDRELEGGWGIGAVDAAVSGADGPWVRTAKGLWVARRDLVPAHPSSFHGEEVEKGRLDAAWVTVDRAPVWSTPSTRQKPTATRARFERVIVSSVRADERQPHPGELVQVGESAWMRADDVARAEAMPPPPEVSGPSERWIDVDTATQTLVAYEGARPVYATLVSTGVSTAAGAPGGSTATPLGISRVWAKLESTDMASGEREDESTPYSMQDVPYVQFFDGAVALHGTYWHADFGHVHSHGCVNLAPLDAQWLFAFTEPRLPHGWSAVLPTPNSSATLVRVR